MKNKMTYFIAMAVFCLSLGACSSSPKKQLDFRTQTGKYGIVGGPDFKDYEIKDLIFATVNIEASGIKDNVDKGIIEEILLKKAKEAGGEDIINVRVWRKDVREQGAREKHVFEYHASALAIKYTHTIKTWENAREDVSLPEPPAARGKKGLLKKIGIGK